MPETASQRLVSSFDSYLHDSLAVLQEMAQESNRNNIDAAVDAIAASLAAGKPLLVCGNGGSAADAIHITGELVGRFLAERRALKAICLSDNPSVLTSISNDDSFDTVFSRQVEAYAESGGTLLAISTSGRSRNVVNAARAAQARAMTVVGLTGRGGGELGTVCDILIAVPSASTPLVQQAHLVVYHFICAAVEARFVATPKADGRALEGSDRR